MNIKNNYQKNTNRGFASLVILFAIVLGAIYFMAVSIEEGQKEQKRYDEGRVDGEQFYNKDEPVTKANAIPRTLEIMSESEIRAEKINQENY